MKFCYFFPHNNPLRYSSLIAQPYGRFNNQVDLTYVPNAKCQCAIMPAQALLQMGALAKARLF